MYIARELADHQPTVDQEVSDLLRSVAGGFSVLREGETQHIYICVSVCAYIHYVCVCVSVCASSNGLVLKSQSGKMVQSLKWKINSRVCFHIPIQNCKHMQIHRGMNRCILPP